MQKEMYLRTWEAPLAPGSTEMSVTGRRWNTVKGKNPLEAIGVSYQA
jgi:hypothetical protein